MAIPEYSKARRLAQKAYRQDMEARRNPYLQVLDEILPLWETVGETDLGLVEIPISQIAGTKTAGRTRAFAGNFNAAPSRGLGVCRQMVFPLPFPSGGRDPGACHCLEFLNCYYVIEGNKRVSVMKYSGAVSLPGYVTRIIPAPGDSPELKIYYEYMDFYRASRVNTIYFSREGSFSRLCQLLGKDLQTPWDEDDRRSFSSAFLRFTEIYEEKGGGRLPLTAGDGFLLYLGVYGWEGMLEKSMEKLRREITLLWPDLEALASAGSVRLITQPAKEEANTGKTLLKKLIPSARPRVTVGFLHHGTIYTSLDLRPRSGPPLPGGQPGRAGDHPGIRRPEKREDSFSAIEQACPGRLPGDFYHLRTLSGIQHPGLHPLSGDPNPELLPEHLQRTSAYLLRPPL